MRVQPFFCCNQIPTEHRPSYECSDRILICKEWYDSCGFNKDHKDILVKISNILGESIVGTILTTHCQRGIVYVPSRLFYRFTITDNVTIHQVEIQNCTAVVLQPLNTNYCLSPTWKDQFVNSLHAYTTLTQKTCIQLNLGTIESFKVIFAQPNKYDTVYMKHGNVIDIRFHNPLEQEKVEWDAKYHYKAEVVSPPVVPFEGLGQSVGGRIHNNTLRELCLVAAKKRQQKYAIQLKLHGPPPEVKYTRIQHKAEKPVLFRQTFQSNTPIPVFIGEGNVMPSLPVAPNLSQRQLCLDAALRRQANHQRTESQGLGVGRQEQTHSDKPLTDVQEELKRIECLNAVKQRIEEYNKSANPELIPKESVPRARLYNDYAAAHAAVASQRKSLDPPT